MAYSKVCVFILFILFSYSCLGEVYKWRDEAGKLHFSDRAPPSSHRNSGPKVEEVRVNPANVVRNNTDIKVLSEQMREGRESADKARREKERSEREKLHSAARDWKSKHCRMVHVPQYRGNVNGTTRIAGYSNQERCDKPVPEKYKPYGSY